MALHGVSPAVAQEAPDEEAPVEEAAEETPMTPEEKQKAAIALFQEGQAALEAENFNEAIEKFEKAFELFPDPGLKVKIGEAYQREGTASRDYDKLRKAVEVYREYIELVSQVDPIPEPTQKSIEGVNERIAQLEESIQAEEERIQRVADEETQAKLDEKLAAEAAEKERLRELAERQKMQVVLAGGVLAGADQQLSGILRFSGGALLSWEHFALEGRVGIDGFLRVDADQGVQARSFTLVDLGARWGANYRYIGPFVSAGGTFGLFSGEPRERKLVDNEGTCGGGSCAFDIDKNISGRVGFGWGFEATEKSTVALRLEVQGWMFSVDDEQGLGNPPASEVEKPQTSIAVMAGLEFLRWM